MTNAPMLNGEMHEITNIPRQIIIPFLKIVSGIAIVCYRSVLYIEGLL